MIPELLAAADLWQTVKDGIPVVLALILIEGLLSVDNALAIAAMASHLPEDQRKTAQPVRARSRVQRGRAQGDLVLTDSLLEWSRAREPHHRRSVHA